ncbi:hypothetical protein [Bacillus mycoides]|uniref:hypothetical protein n=1 Tax=Bacillus mycoides TaxID=1405 RepID=UPI001C029D5B|nr:hypothetical protein [Bacillus mycoides]
MITITSLPNGTSKIHGVDENGDTWCLKFHSNKEIAIQSALETMKTYGRNDEILIK